MGGAYCSRDKVYILTKTSPFSWAWLKQYNLIHQPGYAKRVEPPSCVFRRTRGKSHGWRVASANLPWLMFTLWFLAKQMLQLLSMLMPCVHCFPSVVNICEYWLLKWRKPIKCRCVSVLPRRRPCVWSLKSCRWLCSSPHPLSTLICIDFNPVLAGNVIHTNTPTTEPQLPPTEGVWSRGISVDVYSSPWRPTGSNLYELWLPMKGREEGYGLFRLMCLWPPPDLFIILSSSQASLILLQFCLKMHQLCISGFTWPPHYYRV